LNNIPQSNKPSAGSQQQPEDFVRSWFSGGQGTATEAQNDNLSQTLSSLIQTIRENRWAIIVLMVLGCVAGVFKAVSETPVYRAGLTMAVEPSGYRSGNSTMFDPFAYRFYETQYELIKSRSVAERVVDHLKLVERDSVQQLLVRPSLTRSLALEFTNLTGISLIEQAPSQQVEASKLTPEAAESKRAWLTSIIKGGVNVRGGAKTNLVEVTFDSVNPQFAAEIANSLVDAYIEQGLVSQLNRSQQTTQWLSQRIDGLKISLDEAQQKLQAFLVQEGMFDSSRTDQITTAELTSLNQEYLNARSEFNELSKRYGARHPKITEARSEMNAAKSRLDRKSLTISTSREKQIELSRLEQDVALNQELYEAFLSKFREADLSSSSTKVASARIVDKALAPGAPIYPQKQTIIITWTLGGLFLGIGLAFLREQLDSTFKTGRVIEEKLGLPLLGVVQAMPDSDTAVERYYSSNKRSVFSEAINHIRTGVTYSNVDNPPKVILITSSVQSEGKTTVASNLALSYAQLGSTLLIDADLRRPRIKHIVDTATKAGLVDYVAGVVEFDECVKLDTEEPNLHILKSGTTPPNPLELLASEKFRNIIDTLKVRFEYIVIDTAPVLPASDAVVLGQVCDALLMVVQSDRTTHHMVRDAIKRLNASRVGVEGIILTQADIKKGNPYHYGGYYGYGAYAYVEDSLERKR
jgi:capsular exopolysaccharide synthesis family protein